MGWWDDWGSDAAQFIGGVALGPAYAGAEAIRQKANGEETDWLRIGKTAAAGLGMWTIAGAAQGAEWQRDAAQDAARLAQEAGDKAAEQNRLAGEQALALNQQGQAAAAAEYQRALADYQAQQQSLAGMFAQERQGGALALDQLNAAVLRGDMSGVQLDPSYQFQAAEAQKALERRANAAGMYGSGGSIKDTLRLQQDMASRAYGDAIDRLMGIAVTGQAANQNLQALNQGAMQNIMGAHGALADNASAGNRFAASTLLNTAIQSANARNLVANQINQYNLQATNAQSNAVANANTSIQNGLNTWAYMNARNGG
jgi:hypothetical protein